MSEPGQEEAERLVSQRARDEDKEFEASLRPARMTEFVGQKAIRDNLSIAIQAARKRKEPLDHVLLFGPPGLGKTTLAYILAHEMGAEIRVTSGPVLERAGDLAGLLTNLHEGDVLFIDEVHRLSSVVEEYLYPAMEDFAIDILIDKGPSARSVRLNLPHFTLVGATTRSGLLTSPLRARFGIVERLGYYEVDDLAQIVRRSAILLKTEIDAPGTLEIARRSRGTPRIANRLLRRVRDYAQVKGDGRVGAEMADLALKMLEVDGEGLDQMDKRILRYLADSCGGGPAGLNTLAVAVGEDSETLEEIYEPYLIQKGLLKRTPQGRVLTQAAYRHLGLAQPSSKQQPNLL